VRCRGGVGNFCPMDYQACQALPGAVPGGTRHARYRSLCMRQTRAEHRSGGGETRVCAGSQQSSDRDERHPRDRFWAAFRPSDPATAHCAQVRGPRVRWGDVLCMCQLRVAKAAKIVACAYIPTVCTMRRGVEEKLPSASWHLHWNSQEGAQ
jgi:hypothetical protein